MRWRGNCLRKIQWGTLRFLHTLDYTLLLPLMARLPLVVGYIFSALRGRLNSLIGRDWRSMTLETRHVARQSAMGYRILMPDTPEEKVRALVRERFETESREEFEGRLIVAGRVHKLDCAITPNAFLGACLQRDRGLVLLTPHFDSFILGVVFLGQAGVKINLMSSVGSGNSGVAPAVYNHFVTKYQGMERYMNGGRVLPLEYGMQPFYQMLERKECLIILGDIPTTDGDANAVTPLFLSAQRRLAGGALRMARKTGSDLGAFTCRFDSPRRYQLHGGPLLDANDPLALDAVYGFLSKEISTSPGRWWAADLLPDIPAIVGNENHNAKTECT